MNKEIRAPSLTHLGSPHKLICQRLGALLQGVENESQGTGRVPQVEKLLKQQQAVSPLVRLSRGRHGLTFEMGIEMLGSVISTRMLFGWRWGVLCENC